MTVKPLEVLGNPFVATLLAVISYSAVVGFTILHMAGIGHLTLKYGDTYSQGCLCHGIAQPVREVHVWVQGPDSVKIGSVTEFYLFMTGGPAVQGGFNLDAGKGYVSPGDATSYLWGMEDELTHTEPKNFVDDTVRWRFLYQAPLATGLDTIFSVANSADANLDPSGDEYNFGRNYLLKLVDSVTDVVENSVPTEFRINQNYPNPFNPTTTISFRLEHAAFVECSVYDLAGKFVSSLVNSVLPPGEHAVRFDGSSCSSGIYFCRIRVVPKIANISTDRGGFVVTRKMALIR